MNQNDWGFLRKCLRNGEDMPDKPGHVLTREDPLPPDFTWTDGPVVLIVEVKAGKGTALVGVPYHAPTAFRAQKPGTFLGQRIGDDGEFSFRLGGKGVLLKSGQYVGRVWTEKSFRIGMAQVVDRAYTWNGKSWMPDTEPFQRNTR